MNLYGLRINRSQSKYVNSEAHINAFKSLSNILYSEDTEILFAYGEIFTCDENCSYASIADEYTNFRLDPELIESIDIIKINDINQVGMHPAYDWTDLLIDYVYAYEMGYDYYKMKIQFSCEWFKDIARKPITKEVIDDYYIDMGMGVNQIVFRKDLNGVEIVERINNSEEIDLSKEINRLAEKYDLFHLIKEKED